MTKILTEREKIVLDYVRQNPRKTPTEIAKALGLQNSSYVANNVANTNSQHLTEQWREGKLPEGWYYLRLEPNFENRYDIVYNFGIDFDLYNTEDIEEVLAPVPSYDEIKRLQEQLKEANELLKAYGTESLWESLSLSYNEANEYCKKWGVK